MATTITVTGTGCPIPSATRAGPGVLVRHGGLALQFDAGRGTVMRLTAAGVELPRMTALFVTNHHSDHLVGLADLVLTRWVIDRGADAPPLPVVVPEGPCVDFCERFLGSWDHDVAVRRAHTGGTTARRSTSSPSSVPMACPRCGSTATSG